MGKKKSFFSDKRIIFVYIVIIFILILATTYALSTSSVAINTNTALIGIDETAYGSTTFDSSELDFKPILDSDVETSTDNVIKIDFTVGGASTNNASKDIIYDIALNDLDVNCNLLSPYIKWKLLKNDEEISSGSLDYKFDKIVDGRLVLTTIQQDLADYSAQQTDYDDYTFYMWFSDSCQSSTISECVSSNQLSDQSALLGQNFSGNIEVELYTGAKQELTREPSTAIDSATCNGGYYVFYNYEGGTGTEEVKSVLPGEAYGDLPTPTRTATVTFETNGGEEIEEQTLTYVFEGWYADKNFTQEVTSDTEVTATTNHNLYAKWSSGSITLPAATRTDYTFKGWYSDSNLTTKVGVAGDSYIPVTDIKLYADWLLAEAVIPVGSITTTEDLKETTQTATLSCTDEDGVAGYYWGTTEPTDTTSYTSVTETTSMSVTKTVSSAGTYYLSCKNTAGNISTTVSQVYYSYVVNNMLVNVTGTEGTYTTANYTQASTNTYIAPNGTSLTLASIYTVPTGASSSTFKGISTGVASTTAATVSTTVPTLSANTTYSMWFNRTTYTVTVATTTGGTNKVTSQNNSTGVTATSSGSNKTLTVRYGETITATATASSGYTFAGFSGLSTSTTSPVTTSGITAAGTITASFEDGAAPVASISTTSTLKSASQTATLSCTDSIGVTSYYWGTTSPTSSSTYTTVTLTTSMSVTKTVSSAGTYYLACKDSAGNTSTTVSKVYRSYVVNNMLVNVTGTEGTYTTANYTQASTNTYIAPNGTSLTLASIYTAPTGASTSTFKGVSTGAASTTAATVSTTAPTLSANTTYSMWFNRTTYTVTVATTTGGTNKVTSQNNSTGVTATSSGSNKTLSVRYGETITATATASTGYTFSAFSGLSTSTTSPVTTSGITAAGTITAKFKDSTAPVASISTTSTLKSASQTATLSCTDSIGVVSYYWGTTSPTSFSTYTSVTSTTSMSVTKTVSSAGTYYLACKDSAGNTSTTVSKVYRSYVVNNMLVNVTGTEGTYTTANYTQASTNTYIAPSGTSITLASVYTIPTGASADTFKGVSTRAASTTAATVSTTAPTLSTNTTYSMWFNRTTFGVAAYVSSGYGTVKIVSENNTTGITGTNGSTNGMTVRYGESITVTATPDSGYEFSGWGNLSNSTTNPITLTPNASTTMQATFTATADTTAPVATISSTNTLKATRQTASLFCTDSVGVVSYYWGTTSPTSSSTYTSVTSTTSMAVTKTVSSAGTYYLACKDAEGNTSTTVSKVYNSYVVNNMLVTTTGTITTYTTANYAQTSTGTYIAPNGTTLTLASIYTIPTGSRAAAFKGYSTGAASTTAATVSTTAPTLSANTTYTMWFQRNYVTIQYSTNGGIITSSTSDSSYTYTWTTDDDGVISVSTDGGTTSTSSILVLRYGASTSSAGLANYNNSSYIYITRSGYTAVSEAEWKCLSGCTTSGATFNQAGSVSANSFCSAASANCTVTLGVNWTAVSKKTAVVNSTRYIWKEPGYMMAQDSSNDYWYFPTSGTYQVISYSTSQSSNFYTVQSTIYLGTNTSGATVYVEKDSSGNLLNIRGSGYEEDNWIKVWIKSANVTQGGYSPSVTTITSDVYTVSSTKYYPVWMYYYDGTFTSISS